MTDTAAILLCAGKGTRMGDATKNKVAFDCAGVPVIRRIVDNMREGGVSRFVVVIGHRAENVMAALDGVPGVLYAYQAEQKGTGHAAQCGLRVLEGIGFKGSVVVSMGDKIVSVRIVRELLAKSPELKAVFGVQRREEHPNGGHVMFEGDQPLAIIEYADVKKSAATGAPLPLAGRTFTAAEVSVTPYVNTAFYRFDAQALSAALRDLRADNTQGEIHLTDVIERFASERSLSTFVIDDPADMLTYSTRPELQRNAEQVVEGLPGEALRHVGRLGDFGVRERVTHVWRHVLRGSESVIRVRDVADRIERLGLRHLAVGHCRDVAFRREGAAPDLMGLCGLGDELRRYGVDYLTDDGIDCLRCFQVGVFHKRVGNPKPPRKATLNRIPQIMNGMIVKQYNKS